MTSTTALTTSPTAGSLRVPGARLHFQVRGSGPPVLLVGAPMGADAFGPVGELLADRWTVLTTDPRGVGRSPVDDPDVDSTPEARADDLARLLGHLGAGPAVALGSSGGAVSVLALVQDHPELVTTVIAHEPPLQRLVEDRERLLAGTEDVVATYLKAGSGAAWARFMEVGDIVLPPDDGGQPPVRPEPEPGGQAAADERHFFLHELRPTTGWQPDLAALRSTPARVLVGIGEGSAGEMCDRTSRALAAALGVAPTMFPGSHIGFLEDPPAFAARLRGLIG